MDATFRLELPFLVPGQAQKESTVNEALQRLDMLVQCIVEQEPTNVAPEAPASGACYLVGPVPLGDWSGYAGAIAAWTVGGWRFVSPRDGMRVLIEATGEEACFRDGEWLIGIANVQQVRVGGRRVVAGQFGTIAAPDGGQTVDVQSRTAINAMLTALRHHGLIAG